MQVEEELARFTPKKDTILTIGVFDGVHLGHKHLLSHLTEQARKRRLLSGVVTFIQHPLEFFSPQSKLPHLTDLDERIKLLKKEGVNLVVPLTFDAELACLRAREFIRLLQKHLRMRGLVIGPDFALGKGREGDSNYLRKLGEEMNFTVTVVPPLLVDGEPVSSTAIRGALAEGNMERVWKLAGRSFSLHGRVVTGAGRGVSLGFPTANLDINASHALPPDGVYASWTYINGKTYQALTNIGTCPTFNECDRTVETYVIDYNGNLYGRDLKIDFVERLRGEKRFASVNELKQQIAEDVVKGKAILAAEGKKARV